MTNEEMDFIGGMNMCDEISNEAYKKIMCHCEELEPCDDCISREAVKEMLTEEWTKYMPMELDMNLSFVLEKISELPSVTPKARWIPVSEGLPTERNHYLITVKIDGMNGCKPYYEIQTSWYSDGQFVVEYKGDGLVARRSVIAWMPLPTSYQGEKNG